MAKLRPREELSMAAHVPVAADMLGQQIGQYRITRKIGQGGMGVVYEAVHNQLELRAAVKVLVYSAAQESVQIKRFIDEARTASVVKHSSLVRLFDFGQLPDGTLYMMMEYLSGETLRARLLEAGGRLPPDRALPLVRQMAAALSAVHQAGIIHLDFTPANVMLVPDPEAEGQERAKLLDFGIARFLNKKTVSEQGRSIQGTPRYMSPEQCAGLEGSDRSDVYSLGLVLFEVLAGESPYVLTSLDRQGLLQAHLQQKPRSLRHFLPETPQLLVTLVREMLDKDSTVRPDMKQVVQRLQLLVVEQQDSWATTPARQVKMPALSATITGTVFTRSWLPGSPSPRLRRVLFFVALGIVITLICIGLLSRFVRSRGRSPAPKIQRISKASELTNMGVLPDGPFQMGSTNEVVKEVYQQDLKFDAPNARLDVLEREKKAHLVTLTLFYLDSTEVTTQAFVNWIKMGLEPLDVAPDSEAESEGVRNVRDSKKSVLFAIAPDAGVRYEMGDFSVRPGWEQKPVTWVTWTGALRYCKSYGRTLPSEAQWEYAARGGQDWIYPWGDTPPRSGEVAFKSAVSNRDWDAPADVGLMKQDLSPQGIHDLAGNVREWVFDVFSAPYPDCGNCIDPQFGKEIADDGEVTYRIFRGGSYKYNNPTLLRAARRGRWMETAGAEDIGFRCAGPPKAKP